MPWPSEDSNGDSNAWWRARSRARSGPASAPSSWPGAWPGRWTTTCRSASGAHRWPPTTSRSTSRPATTSEFAEVATPSAASCATRPGRTPATRATGSWARSTSSWSSTSASAPAGSRSRAASGRGAGGAGAGSLVLPTGERFTLGRARHHHRPPARVEHRAGRPQRQPQPRRDPPPGRRLRAGRPRLDQRLEGQRRAGRPARSSTTATRSASATPGCGSRPAEQHPVGPSAAGYPIISRSVPEQLLNLLKLFLLVLLYLFFLRVLRAVWTEVERPAPGRPPARRRAGASRGAQPPPARPGRTNHPQLKVLEPAGAAGPQLRARRGDHPRPGRRVPGAPRRHLRHPAPRPRVPARRAAGTSRTSARPTAPT